MRRKLTDVARVIRSKNSGPFELTLDIMFKDRAAFDAFRARGVLTPAVVARLYGVPEQHILKFIFFEPANAMKVTLRRPVPSGAPGDSDIYGAQQHAPLMTFEFDE
jgi:hypothetical protein